MKNETSGEAAYSPKIGELVTIRDEVDKTDKDHPLHITLRYVAAGMREGYRQARADYTPPTGELQGKDWRDTTLKILEKQNKHLMELVANMDLQRPIFIEVPKPQPPAEVWNEHCPVFSHDKCQGMIFKDAEGGEMSEPLAKDQLKEMIRQLKAWGYNASEIENAKLKSQLAEHEANGLLVYGRKIECLKAELQRTRDLLGSWINKATKAHKELEKLKHGQS